MSRIGPLGDGRAGCEALEAVRRAGVDVEIDGHAGLAQPHGVVDVLVGEAVDGADGDERRRQPGEVGGPRRRGVRLGTSAPPLRSPRYAVQPYVLAPGGQHRVGPLAGRRDLAVVEHRVDQQLERQRHLAPVAGQQASPAARPAPALGPPMPMRARDRRRARRRARAPTPARRSSRRAAPGTASPATGGTRTDTPTHAEQRAPPVEAGVVAGVVAEHEPAAVHPVHARQRALDADRTVDPHDDAAGARDLVVGAHRPCR